MSRLVRWISFYFSYGVPLIVIAVVGYVMFEQFHPWEAANSVLPHLPNETRVSIGAGAESRGDQSERYAEYVYLPSHWSDAKVYVVQQHNNGTPTLIETDRSIVSPIVIVGLVIAGSVWFWRRHRRQVQSNTSLERTRAG